MYIHVILIIMYILNVDSGANTHCLFSPDIVPRDANMKGKFIQHFGGKKIAFKDNITSIFFC